MDGWFCENRPRTNLRKLNLVIAMIVGIKKSNRVPPLV